MYDETFLLNSKHAKTGIPSHSNPLISIGGKYQRFLNAMIMKFQDSCRFLFSKSRKIDILAESRWLGPRPLEQLKLHSSHISIDNGQTTNEGFEFVVSFADLNSSLPHKNNRYQQLLLNTAATNISPYQYITMDSKGSILATESVPSASKFEKKI